MIQIQKGQTNQNLIFTLTENTTVVDPVYLFIFESDQTGVKYPVISTDLASAAEKPLFNKFTIIEGTDDPENGEFILPHTGTYHVFVYAQASTTNLDPELADELVERAWANVFDTEASNYVCHEPDVSYVVNG